jgi:hypothetical protein
MRQYLPLLIRKIRRLHAAPPAGSLAQSVPTSGAKRKNVVY